MKTKGFAVSGIIWVVGILGAGLVAAVPSWRPNSWFQKGPETKALAQAQLDLQKAKDEAKIAQDALNAVRAAEEARKVTQLTFGHEMSYGAGEALKTAPVSPQVVLAQSLLARANPALTAALGELPQDKRNEIMLIVSQSLSGAADELAKANATLALRDKELAVATAERSALQTQIPALQTALETKTKQVEVVSEVVAAKTAIVAKMADSLFEEKKKAGSLGALISSMWNIVAVLAVLTVLGFGVAAWLKFKFGGIAGAVGSGLAELREKHPDAASLVTTIFDSNLNRHEQTLISKHAS